MKGNLFDEKGTLEYESKAYNYTVSGYGDGYKEEFYGSRNVIFKFDTPIPFEALNTVIVPIVGKNVFDFFSKIIDVKSRVLQKLEEETKQTTGLLINEFKCEQFGHSDKSKSWSEFKGLVGDLKVRIEDFYHDTDGCGIEEYTKFEKI